MAIDQALWDDVARISAADAPALSEGFCPRCLAPLVAPILSVDPAIEHTAALATACSNGACGIVYILRTFAAAPAPC